MEQAKQGGNETAPEMAGYYRGAGCFSLKAAELNELLGRQTEPAAPRCGSCGAPVREGDLFCRECGGKL